MFDRDDLRVIGQGAILLLTLAIVVLALAGIAGAALRVFSLAGGV